MRLHPRAKVTKVKYLKPIKRKNAVYIRKATRSRYGVTMNVEKITFKNKRALKARYKKALDEYYKSK